MSESSSKSSQPLASKQEKDGTEKRGRGRPRKQPPVSPGTALVGSQVGVHVFASVYPFGPGRYQASCRRKQERSRAESFLSACPPHVPAQPTLTNSQTLLRPQQKWGPSLRSALREATCSDFPPVLPPVFIEE